MCWRPRAPIRRSSTPCRRRSLFFGAPRTPRPIACLVTTDRALHARPTHIQAAPKQILTIYGGEVFAMVRARRQALRILLRPALNRLLPTMLGTKGRLITSARAEAVHGRPTI